MASRPRLAPSPHAQVRTLIRSAKIALGKAERCRLYTTAEEADAYEAKAKAAVNEAIRLNREHNLGYPVPSDITHV